MISEGADVNARDNDNQTALHVAARGDSLKVAKLLLKNNADFSIKTTLGLTALAYAIFTQSTNVLQLLLEVIGASKD